MWRARIGNPMLPETNVGPVATAKFEKVLRYIKIAQAEGAQCVLMVESIRWTSVQSVV